MGCGGSMPVYTSLEDQVKYTDDSEGESGVIEDILRGNFSTECPSTAKLVRIFTSSTFTDTLYERNTLIEKVYPKLKAFCQSRGYEFQVVDMRWGVRDEATDDHMTSELCLREVDLCKKLSTGPSFVTFLSHKYGYRYFPRQIEAEEFELIRNNLDSDDVRQLLDRWFRKDENSIPPTYILQPISSYIPEFLSTNPDDKKKGRSMWYEQNEKMQTGIIKSAKFCLDQDNVDKYLMSVTEVEIRRGILHSKVDSERSFWFHRVIDDIDQQPSSYVLSRYKDCSGDESHMVQAQQMLQKLREMRLKPALPEDHYKSYNVPWTEKGIDPNSVSSHQKYIDEMCEDFERDMKEMINAAISKKEKSLINSELYQEVVQHTVFCQEKCQAFHGRKRILSSIRTYLLNESQEPCVVYGSSGCGKTSVIAKAANLCREWRGNNTVTILRFLGTTPGSSSIGSLLLSLINQINLVYGSKSTKVYTTLRDIIDEFQKSLGLANKQKPLIIFLDSLDQLDPSGNARQMFWLPKRLPRDVKLVLSTLPESQYEYFPKLQAMFPNKSHRQFIEVPSLPEKDAVGILTKWFDLRQRTLRPNQMKTLLQAFNNCPLPLFLKLAFDEACLWKSYTTPEQTVLETSVRGIVNHLFARIEALHGKMLVSRALGYLTLSKNGLTEAELEDILSCDDDVLQDVYMYWTPPIRRLPPLLLVRMRSELEQYFVVRGADGARVTYWYHRQFFEAARDRYLSDEGVVQTMHSTLADYFSGVWSNGKPKPYTNNKNQQESADRHVASQPLLFGETYNYRKINNLAFHRLRSGEIELLKSECLCCYSFISAKLKSQGLRQLLDEYNGARKVYPDDEDIMCIEDALQLSQNALQFNPDELPSQLLGRIQGNNSLKQLLEDCRRSPTYYLQPNQSVLVKPGGILVHCLAQHSDQPTSVDISSDGSIAVTCSHDKSINVWDIRQGRLLKTFDEVAVKIGTLRILSNNTVVFSCAQGFVAFDIDTGTEVYSLDEGVSFCFCGVANEYLSTVNKDKLFLWNSTTGSRIGQYACSLTELDGASRCIGCEKYVAITCNQNKDVVIFDVSSRTFVQVFNGYCEVFVFSPDCSRLFTSHKFTPVLYVYDMNEMKRCKTIQGAENIFAQGSLKATKDCRYIYFYYYSSVYVWDIEKETQTILIDHPTAITDVTSLDGKTVVTAAQDRAVRIWDLDRSKDDERNLDKNGNNGAKIMSTVLFNNPRYAVFKIKKGHKWSWQLYDLYEQKPMKKSTKFVPNCEKFVDDEHILMCGYRNIKLLNLTSMEFTVTYEGQINGTITGVKVVKQGQEFVTWTKEQNGIKVFDVKSGKCLKKINNRHKLDSFTINKDETVLILQGICEQVTVFYIYDLNTYELKATIKCDSLGLDSNCVNAKEFVVTTNGETLIFTYMEQEENMYVICVDISTEICERHAVVNSNKRNKQTVKLEMLTSSTVLVYQEDYFMEVRDIKDGSVLFQTDNCNKVSIPDNGPYFLTFGKLKGDNAVRVWDRKKLSSLASFYMDAEIRTAQCLLDGHHILLATQETGDPIVFEMKGGAQQPRYFNYKNLKDYKQLFSSSDEDKDIMVMDEEEKRVR